jgi:hypothetical protein
MSWFPLSEQLMEASPEFQALTPADKIYLFFMISEFNLRRTQFYKSDLEVAVTLGVNEKTIRRARKKLIELGWMKAKPGTRTGRGQCLATTYLWLKWAAVPQNNFFAQLPRHTFNVMLDRLMESRLQAGDVVVYVCLFYWFWRNRGKNEDRDRFFITKKKLQSLTNLKAASTRITRIYEAIVFSNGKHLFEYQDDYHRVVVKDWTWCADPSENEPNRRNEERHLNKIKDLVTQEKQNKQLKIQEKMVKQPKKTDPCSLSLLTFFYELYMKRHGRMPNHRGDKRLRKLEQIYDRGAIHQAINWYFTADTVPNGSGARTRTLGNFISHIDDILKLSSQYMFV